MHIIIAASYAVDFSSIDSISPNQILISKVEYILTKRPKNRLFVQSTTNRLPACLLLNGGL